MDRPVGSLAVNATGFATYKYPIALPPGIQHGVETKISLKFSHGLTANGMLGRKWSLGGLSSIVLIPPTIAVDNGSFKSNGSTTNGPVAFRYALDGAELLCVQGDYGAPGSVYRLEIDDGTGKLITLTAASSFVVSNFFGFRQEYGSLPDSVIKSADLKTIFEWKISKSFDFRGNYILYTYTNVPTLDAASPPVPPQESGIAYVSSITYINNDLAKVSGKIKVNFLYQSRPDTVRSTTWGRLTCTTHLLSQITTTANGVACRSYNLGYTASIATGDSLLTSVVEVGSAGSLLSPTTFKYTGLAPSDWTVFSQTRANVQTLPSTPNSLVLIPINMSGRSCADLACITNDSDNNLSLTPFQAQPNKQASQSNTSDYWTTVPTKYSGTDLLTITGPDKLSYLTGDVNNDGRTDIIIPYQAPDSSLTFGIAIANQSGYATVKTISTRNDWQDGSKFFAVDVDGDGFLDIVQFYTDSDEVTHHLCTYYGVSTATTAKDFDSFAFEWRDPSETQDIFPIRIQQTNSTGLVRVTETSDGMTDSTTVSADIFACPGSNFTRKAFALVNKVPITLATFKTSSRPQYAILAADINGDGSEDIVVCTYLATPINDTLALKFTFQTFLFDGASAYEMLPETTYTYTVSTYDRPSASGSFYVMNLDGSSYPCIMYVYQKNQSQDWTAVFGMGSSSGSMNSFATTTIASGSNTSIGVDWTLIPTDVNGVGRGGFLMQSWDDDSASFTICPIFNVNGLSDYLTTVINPLGLRQDLSYSPMSSSDLYDSGVDWTTYATADGVGDVRVIGSATHLVSSLRTQNDPSTNELAVAGGEGRTKTYSYKSGSMSRSGRGWLGFATTIETNVEDGVRYVSTYNQTWPAAGQLLQRDTYGSTHVNLLGRLANWPAVHAKDVLILLRSSVSSYEVKNLSVTKGTETLSLWLSRLTDKTDTKFDEDGSRQTTHGIHYDYFEDTCQKQLTYDYEYNEATKLYNSQIWSRTSYATSTAAVKYLPEAKKVSAAEGNANMSTFEPGDLSLMLFTYDPISSSLKTTQTWSTDLQAFSSTSHTFDASGNETSSVEQSGLTIRTTYDPVYNSFPISKTFVGDRVNQQTHHAFDPRYGVEVLSCSAYGDIAYVVLDEWGRQVQKWQLTSHQSGNAPDRSSPEIPAGLVIDTYTQARMSSLEFSMSEQVAYKIVTVSPTSRYQCRTRMWYTGNESGNESPSEEYVGPEGNLRLIKSQDNGLAPVTWQYREFNQKKMMILESFPTVTNQGTGWKPDYKLCKLVSYDALDRPVMSLSPPTNTLGVDAGALYSTLESIYSNGGNSRTTHLRQSSTFQYNATGTVIESLQYSFARYNKQLRMTSATNNSMLTRHYQYDALGKLLQVTDPAAKEEHREYNSFGQLSTVNNPDQNPTGQSYAVKYIHDASGFLVSSINAMNQKTTYHNDAKGRLWTRVDWDGRTTSYTYDTPNNIDKLYTVSITSPTGQTELTWTYEYDARGLRQSETLTLYVGTQSYGPFKTSYEYDLQGNITQRTLPDTSQINYVFKGSALDQISLKCASQEASSGNMTTNFTNYDINGMSQLWDLTAPTGSSISGTATFDLLSRPLTQGFVAGTSTIVNANFRYDALGQILTHNDLLEKTSTSYTYTDRRLMSSASGTATSNYTYDNSGNIMTNRGMNMAYTSSTTGAQIAGDGNGMTYNCTLDAAGRMVTRQVSGTSPINMTYDGYGKMRTITAQGVARTIISDHKQRTIAKTDSSGTIEIYCSRDYSILVQADKTTTIRKKVFSGGQLLASVVSQYDPSSTTPKAVTFNTYVTNHKGSITHILDEKGLLLQQLTYDDYGKLLSVTKNGASSPSPTIEAQSTYEAKTLDLPTGLLDFAGRWYDPILGRFTTPDWNLPAKYLLRPDGINLFAFERNNPINAIDPSGHIDWDSIGGFFIGAALAVGAVVVGVATGGLGLVGFAAVAVEVGEGFLLGGGLAALGYTYDHRGMTDAAQFWKGFGVDVAIGAGFGAVTGGAGSWFSSIDVAGSMMAVGGDTLEDAAAAPEAATQINNKYILVLGGKALFNGVAGVAQDASDVEANNAVMGTHDKLDWKDLALAGLEGAGGSVASDLKEPLLETPQGVAAKNFLTSRAKGLWQKVVPDENFGKEFLGDVEMDDLGGS